MRHVVFGRKLGRDVAARKALLRNLASSLLVSGSIVTTESKAKFAKSFVEKIITTAGRNKLIQNRRLSAQITNKALQKLIKEVGPGFKNRNGGYTRIIKMSGRLGDGAPMAKLELLKFDQAVKSPEPKKVQAAETKPVKK